MFERVIATLEEKYQFKIEHVEPLNKGFSDDEKYVVTSQQRKYLLKVSPENRIENAISSVELMTLVKNVGVPVNEIVYHGHVDHYYFILMSYIDADDGEIGLEKRNDDEQYELGLLAGKYLKMIHSIPVKENNMEWKQYFNEKIDRKIKMYQECTLDYPNGEKMIQILEDNRYLVEDSEVVNHHGDYHIGNMLIDDDNNLYIIDFDRHDVGEPWEEFNRIVWCARISPKFAKGRVDGYFNNDVPEKFWRLLLVYLLSNALSSLPWAVPFGKKEIDIMQSIAEEMETWYDGYNEIVPVWYR